MVQDESNINASQTSFMHIDLRELRELIGDAPDAELRLAELALSNTLRQSLRLEASMESKDIAAVKASVNGLRNALTALHAERALHSLDWVELDANIADLAALDVSGRQLAVECELVCKNLAEQIARLKKRAA
jgi:hypothetical protein